MDGKSLRSICTDKELPSRRTVFNWLNRNPGFVHQYVRARDIQADVIFDEMHDIADNLAVGIKRVTKPSGEEITEADMIEHRRLQIETRKWMLGKMAPKKYGEKTQIEHSGAVASYDLSKVTDGDLRQLEAILDNASTSNRGPE